MIRTMLCLFLAAGLLVPPALAEIVYKGGDGGSPETAIVITGAEGSLDGIQSEYDWVKRNRPGAKVVSQALLESDGRVYDRLTLRVGGRTEEVYFDITAFFGRF